MQGKENEETDLDERARVDLVLRCDLKTDIGASGRVPSCLGACLDFWGDLVVVGSGKDGEVVCCGDGGSIADLAVSGGKSVLGDSSLADIVATFSTDKEAFMADCDIEG